MRRILLSAVACLVLAAACAPEAAAPKADLPPPQEWAAFPAPAFLENLTEAPDGSVIFTNYTGRSLHRIDPATASVRAFTTLDTHPVSLLPLGDGYLVSGHAIPFTAGPDFIGSGELLTLDAAGAVVSRLRVPGAGFLNGMVALPDGSVLIADSAGAQILRFDPTASAVSPWFTDPALAPQQEPFLPGANGLKLRDGALLVSSSTARTVWRLAIGPDGKPSGALEVVKDGLPGADDFVVLPEGGLVVATHGSSVVRVGTDGSVTTVVDNSRIQGNTAVALTGTGAERKVLILGTGGLSEGNAEDGVVWSVPLPG